jgi:signal transduction histidine kinase
VVDLSSILETASHAAAPEFAARGARLEPPRSDRSPDGLSGDPGALDQLFLNLLLNAAQALEPGGRAGILTHGGDGWIDVSIWDTGRGIPEEALARVFEPFYTTRSDGTGLGLAVAQRIAVAHGGEIRIESTPERGTTVHVRLPVRPDATQ